MKNKRRLFFRILALALLAALAVCMFVIGRGHTLYFDNKELTAADGTVYKPFYKVEIYEGDTRVAKLSPGDRGMVSVMGQSYSMVLHILPTKDGKKVGSAVKLQVPFNMDGIIYNLPAMLNGAEEEVYRDEFVPAPVEEESEEAVSLDEFAMPADG